MQIRHISIKHFRGILSLDWTLIGSTICLIGPNDSRKSTILDAIEYALSPRWNLPFYDTDFYKSDISKPIVIEITVGELPEKLVALNKLGGHLRGWTKSNSLKDEPDDQSESVLSIRLTVDISLEPVWKVFTDRTPDGVTILSTDREQLYLSRVGSYVDRELTWGRATSLTRITSDLSNVPATLAKINRVARQAFSDADDADIEELKKASEVVENAAKQFGVKPQTKFKPAIDAQASGMSNGGLALYDGEVPSRQLGLGSRRLLTAAIQKTLSKDGVVLLVDEIEHGLEPHRLRQFIRLIRATNKNDDSPYIAQIIMTTHSTTAIVELDAAEIQVVRANNGIISIKQVTNDLQKLVRHMPDALLAKRVIVCEGRTEFGILRTMDEYWAPQNNNQSFAYYGAIAVDGGGSNAREYAISLAKLGYEVLLFIDSDIELTLSNEQQLKTMGIKLIEWADKTRTEARLCHDLSWSSLQKLVDLAIDFVGQDSILMRINNELNPNSPKITSTKIDYWLSADVTEQIVRDAIEKAEEASNKAKSKKTWFKNIDQGKALGHIIIEDIPQIAGKDLYQKLTEIREWVQVL